PRWLGRRAGRVRVVAARAGGVGARAFRERAREPHEPASLSPTWNVFSAARRRCNIYYAQNQIVKSLSKLIDKTTRHGVPHFGTRRVDGALRRPDHGQRATKI